MKTIKQYILICIALLFAAGCDEDFVEVNTNPYAVTEVDPALLFAGAQRSHLGTWAAEHTIVQHFVSPYNQGATLGFNFNSDIDGISTPKWDQSYPGPIRSISQAMTLLGPDTERVNLMSMLRIWKVQIFMGLVDEYGDVPYFDAGKGLERTNESFYPKYDDDAAIYLDLHKELQEALAALNPGADYVSADLFYGANAQAAVKTTTSADQVAKWKKLGNSLLLRLGMRYSKADPAKAQSIVAEAFAGGVMESNADNAYVKYDGTLNAQTENNNLRNFSHFNYAAEPFVDQLKSTNDPRGKFILATFTDPGAVSNEANPNTDLASQFGVPIGVNNVTLAAGGVHRGPRGTGLNYSQMNVWKVASPAAPDFYVTYSQTSLLLAEAAVRGWVSGDAKTYYENGIKADMEVYALYPGTTAISTTDIATYLADPGVDFNQATTDEEAFELINTQYWIVNLRNGSEAFANFRRSGYPVLAPNLANNNLNGGFIRRMSYPDVEGSANSKNYGDAVTAIGGDKLTTRVFWDVP
ncbi:SusD/RagB family nutrient-binding outer membrane lipoprotein [Chryseolinea sp. H1M3-3]|uniref:SusD/RagB family nutrient-binding outer membrane lipoprotein n=1 Tax=Chryseolinea sp. H1M3-3 TaxID=3034144 RepID=UPI0023ECD942|nr:SusD/RagB family nutrient-binding outer membrane lipoprotein [Chryseolinea sp. H1M3-3]